MHLRNRARLREFAALALAGLAGCAPAASASPPASTQPNSARAGATASASASAPEPGGASGADASAEPAPGVPPDPPIVLHGGGKAAVKGEAGVVTTVERNATRVGVGVLEAGGNAIDAAVAVGYALAVTHPSAGNIGGGGFMLVRLASGEVHAIDFREAAPVAATTAGILAMIKDGAGGYRAPAVPGTVAGLDYVRDHFGTKPLTELLAPAIALARKGHKLGHRQAQVLAWAWPKLQVDRGARAIFGKARGKDALAEGETLKQPELARTLEAIAKSGDAGFYAGVVAEKIDKAMRAHGGYVTAADLAAYRVKERAPLRFAYRGLTVDTMPPPSMGGVAFAEIMLALERARAHETPLDSGASLHFFIEVARRAYAERRLVGADPDLNPPEMMGTLLPHLLDASYLESRKPAIDPERATPSSALSQKIDDSPYESPQTTHFSIVDAMGNAVSCTYTQSASYGAKIVVPGTGVLFNNSLGAFSEAGPNAVAAGKRMASSMTPTLVSQGGRLALVLGSPGGDTIPNTVAQVMRNLVDYGMTIDEAVAHPRLHEQWLPDKVRVEKLNPPPKAALDDLVRRGHTLDLDVMPIGDANDILVDPEGVPWAYADPREGGKAESARPAKR